jgi:hypothetical protein
MTWKTPLEVTHDDYIADKTGGIVPLDEIVAALNAAPQRAFSDLTEDALEKMVEASLLKPGGPVVLLTLLHHLQVFAAPSWEPLSHGAEYPETFLLCRKDGSSGAVPGGYDKRNPHFYVFDSDGSSWIENADDWLWMPPPAVPNGPEGGAA